MSDSKVTDYGGDPTRDCSVENAIQSMIIFLSQFYKNFAPTHLATVLRKDPFDNSKPLS
jgi:hypothetical protein